MSRNQPDYDKVKSVFEFSVPNIRGELVRLEKYEGHVCIFVNVASDSKFTDYNYKILNSLYDKYAEKQGLRILAFPCNQFGLEEPGSAADIAALAAARGVKFDVFEKTRVNCDHASPVWKYLKKAYRRPEDKSSVITSSYTKFVVSARGQPVRRFGPDAIEAQLRDALLFCFNSDKQQRKPELI